MLAVAEGWPEFAFVHRTFVAADDGPSERRTAREQEHHECTCPRCDEYGHWLQDGAPVSAEIDGGCGGWP